MKILNKLTECKQWIIRIVICSAYGHDWSYNKEPEHWKNNQYRECKKCGRYEHKIYNNEFSMTYWIKWNKHCI